MIYAFNSVVNVKACDLCVLLFHFCTQLLSAFFCWVVFELGPFWAKQLVTVALSDAAGSSFSPKDRLFGDNSARHTGLGAYIWIPQRLPFHSRNFKQEYTMPKIYLLEGLKISCLCFWSKAVRKWWGYHPVKNFAEERVGYMCNERSLLSFGLVKFPEIFFSERKTQPCKTVYSNVSMWIMGWLWHRRWWTTVWHWSN